MSREAIRAAAIAFMRRTFTDRIGLAAALGIRTDDLVDRHPDDASFEMLRRIRQAGKRGALMEALRD